MAIQRYCTSCGAARTDERAAFCATCGRSFSAETQPEPGGATALEATSLAGPRWPAEALANARKRPLWAVFLLTAGTLSIYFFVHLGLMWAEMKRARADPSMNPVGHFLAQFVRSTVVPFSRPRVDPQHMLELSGSSLRVSREGHRRVHRHSVVGSFPEARPRRLADLPAYAAYGVFAAWRQRALNAFYDQVSQGAIPERVHGLEWVVMVIGVLILALAAIGIFAPPVA